MAKLGAVSDDTRNLVDEILGKTGLANFVNAEVMSITKQKQIVTVKRANATTEYLANKPDSICIYVYEDAFDRLDENARYLVMEDALNTVYYDTEKDKIVITPQQIMVTMGGRAKYGETLINAIEAGVHVIAQIEEEEKEKKEQSKKKKNDN